MNRGDDVGFGRRGRRLIVVGLAVAVLAAACGSGSDDSGGNEPDGEPQDGGEIVAGLEAETDGLNPTTNRWAVAGLQIAAAVFDPLMAYNDEGEVRPYLAESMEPVEGTDFTEWTLKIRPGITFHDGTPVDAAAVKRNIDGHIDSILTQSVFRGLQKPEIVDDLTLSLKTDFPWASLPALFVNQTGYVAAPSMLDAEDGGEQAPVGSGPFKLESRTVDSQTVVVKNENYWQEGLPHLDKITFRIVPDEQQRSTALAAGDIDLTQTDRDEEVAAFESNPDIEVFLATDDEEENLYLNQDNPNGQLADERVREAVSYAVDREGHNDLLGSGVTEVADSAWGPDSKFYPGDSVTHIPYDPEKAEELVDEYESETGEQIELDLLTTPNPDNAASMDFIKENLDAVGIDSTITKIEQSEFISQLIGGTYDIALVRQFGDPDPDVDAVWWFSENADEAVALNFVRNRDPEVDRLLMEARATTDFETRRDLYAEVAQRQNDAAVYVRLYHTVWAVAWRNNVHSVTEWELPDGETGLPIVRGRYQTAQIWAS